MRPWKSRQLRPWLVGLAACAALLYWVRPSPTQSGGDKPAKRDVGNTSYDQLAPVLLGKETFAERMAKDVAGKEAIMARQKALLLERYDLTRKVDEKITMTRGKP